jgi:hypothetical protein
MVHQLLIPGMQYRKETNAGTEPLRVRCNGQQRFRDSPKQQPIDKSRIL